MNILSLSLCVECERLSECLPQTFPRSLQLNFLGFEYMYH